MFLCLEEAEVPMKLVFQLTEELKRDQERVTLAQALTLNEAKPHAGLRGRYGLFASQEWWDNIEQGKMPCQLISGVISRVYVGGQNETVNNMIDLMTPDGEVKGEGIFLNDRADVKLFRVGCRADILLALDEMKHQPAANGGINYSKVTLEMAVSLEPVAKA